MLKLTENFFGILISARLCLFLFGNAHDFCPSKIHSVNVKYIIDYKVKLLRYTRTYNLSGRRCRGMIFEDCQNSLYDLVSFRFVSFRFSLYIFCFVSFLSLQILFRFVVFRFVSLCFVSFRCVSFLFRFSLYRDPIQKAVVICLIIPTIFSFDAGSSIKKIPECMTYVVHPGSSIKRNVVGMIRQMTTAF